MKRGPTAPATLADTTRVPYQRALTWGMACSLAWGCRP